MRLELTKFQSYIEMIVTEQFQRKLKNESTILNYSKPFDLLSHVFPLVWTAIVSKHFNSLSLS